MVMVDVKVTKTAKISGSTLNLGQLRGLVKACEGMDDRANVSVSYYAGDFRESGTSSSITVTG